MRQPRGGLGGELRDLGRLRLDEHLHRVGGLVLGVVHALVPVVLEAAWAAVLAVLLVAHTGHTIDQLDVLV